MADVVGDDPLYRVPLVRHDDAVSFDPTGFPRAIHTVGTGELVLHAMVRLQPGPYLLVVLHGAVNREKKRLPFFERIKTSMNLGVPFVLLEDPALWLDPHLTTGWYLGTEQVDPVPAMLQIVERVRRQVGTERVLFLGGSAGGFAALQCSAQVANSLAFVWNPQTSAANFLKPPHKLLLKVAFPTIGAAAIGREPERFSCVARYRRRPLRNRIYYVQNRQDVNHWGPHFEPFAEALGVPAADGCYLDGAVRLVEVDLGFGHAPLRTPAWDEHFARAVAMLTSAGCRAE